LGGRASWLPDLVVDEHRVLIPDAWVELFPERERFRFPAEPGALIDDSANLAAEGQAAFESALLRLAARLLERSSRHDLCFAGGAALNCSANAHLPRESRFRDPFIPPSPHDGGTAVGCALFGLIEVLGERSDFRWRNDVLGPDPDDSALAAALHAETRELVVERPTTCWARHINFHVNAREWFRPLAPVVLADEASRILHIDRPARFMQFAANVRPESCAQLPAITHVDGTARLLTVDAENHPLLHALLTRFDERTGCPVLLNTSLNGPGDPLTETPAQSLATFRTTAMHALALPPFLVRKLVEPRLPQ